MRSGYICIFTCVISLPVHDLCWIGDLHYRLTRADPRLGLHVMVHGCTSNREVRSGQFELTDD
jgi:hypothetical protein